MDGRKKPTKERSLQQMEREEWVGCKLKKGYCWGGVSKMESQCNARLFVERKRKVTLSRERERVPLPPTKNTNYTLSP